jgi:hypothetical protein
MLREATGTHSCSKKRYLLWLCERCRVQIGVNVRRDQQGKDLIAAYGLFERIKDRLERPLFLIWEVSDRALG